MFNANDITVCEDAEDISLKYAADIGSLEDGTLHAALAYDHRGRLDQFAFGKGGHSTGVYAECLPEDQFDLYHITEEQRNGRTGYRINRSTFETTREFSRDAFGADEILASFFLKELDNAMQNGAKQDRYGEFITAQEVEADDTVPAMYVELFS